MFEIRQHGDVTELQMNHAPANAMDTAFVNGMRDAFGGMVDSGVKAVVISGRDGMFSGGVDVPALLPLERAAVLEFWTAFLQLMSDIATSPVPVVAAITGHSPAGGAVLALHCDYRVAASGKFKIGLNEVQVGLPVPSSVLGVLGFVTGQRTAQRLTMQGLLVSPDEALDAGLVDELAAPDEVVSRAVGFAASLTALPPVAMNTTRIQAKQGLLRSLAVVADAEATTDYWFSDETQAAMNALVERLQNR